VNKEYTDLLKYLSSKVLEEVEVVKNEVALGRAKDHAEYKLLCGKISGLILANEILKETFERIKDE
jgi:hypothetical protein